MTKYAAHVSTKKTPQNEPIPGTKQVANSSGGFSFPVDDWTRLDRFLVLGAEGGSYYASERKLTVENAAAVNRCLAADGLRTVARIAEISEAGRAPKNDPAIFALALAASFKPSVETRWAALAAMPKVCRTGTMLFQFNETVEQLRGRGRALNRAVTRWYLDKEPRELAYQCAKYQQRNGWSHRDLLRLAKPKAAGAHQDIFHWVAKGWPAGAEDVRAKAELRPIWALEQAKRASSKEEICRLIRDCDLVRECVPTQWLTEAAVWEALLDKMPLTAMIRNLATMTRVGLLAPLAQAVGTVSARLASDDLLRKARIHPIAVLAALLTYQAGRGERGKNTWEPVAQVVDALDGAFYRTFATVEPTGKRWLLALDVSGSMSGGTIGGVPGLSPRLGSCAMALVTAATEPQQHFLAFTSGGWQCRAAGRGQYVSMGYSNGLTPFDVSPRERLDDVCRKTAALPMGGTDCALPMLYATEQKLPVDIFAVYTDSETWAGNIHPVQALREYRQRMGIGAKLIVVGMVSNGFSIADPDDGGMMDFVGFDTAAPAVMADFASGR